MFVLLKFSLLLWCVDNDLTVLVFLDVGFINFTFNYFYPVRLLFFIYFNLILCDVLCCLFWAVTVFLFNLVIVTITMFSFYIIINNITILLYPLFLEALTFDFPLRETWPFFGEMAFSRLCNWVHSDKMASLTYHFCFKYSFHLLVQLGWCLTGSFRFG